MTPISTAIVSRVLRTPPSLKQRMIFAAWMFCFAIAFCACPQTAEGAGESLQLRNAHPYLFFTAEDVARLKDRIEKEKPAEKAWSQILAGANRAAEQADAGGTRGGGERGSSGMERLCLAFRMTGDNKFAQRIKQLLQTQMRRADFSEAYLLERDPPWHSGLQTGGTCYNFAVGFDCIHDFLSPEERKTFAGAMVEKGIDPILNDWVLGDKRIHSLDTMGHNWWSVCVFNAGLASIALMDEEPRARRWVERIGAGSAEWLAYAGSALETKPRTIDREGGFYESVNYADLALSEYLRFRLGWSNAFRRPKAADAPVIEKFGDFFCNFCYPQKGRVVPVLFGDGSLTASGRRSVSMAWYNGIHEKNYLWYLNQFKQVSSGAGDRVSAFDLAYGPTEADIADAPNLPDLPNSAVYPDMGWAALRSSWEKNATLLAVKSGFTWNHSHADAGSFVLFHRGEYLLVDSGGSPGYAAPEYDGYYRQSAAHNVVLFNGQAQNPEDTYFGSQFPGAVSHLMDAGDLKYVLADATGPTAWRFARNFRHFLWIGDVILIIDDVKSFEPGQFEWLLHVGGKAKINGLDLEVVGENASVLVRPLFPETFPGNAGLSTDYPEKMRLVEKSGFKDHDVKNKDTYYAFTPAELTRRTKFIVALILVNDANRHNLPKLERLQSLEMNGVRIRQKGTITDVYLNLLADGRIRHRNANATINGWETDAYLMALTFPEPSDTSDFDAATRLFIADGSYLRRNGKVLLDSLSKIWLTATKQGDTLDLLLQGQPVVNAILRAAGKPSDMLLNGEKIKPSYDESSKTITISLPRQ
jgi:oligo-alginate lyase